jgi:hypothetical protein
VLSSKESVLVKRRGGAALGGASLLAERTDTACYAATSTYSTELLGLGMGVEIVIDLRFP